MKSTSNQIHNVEEITRMSNVIRKYSGGADDRSFEGPLIRVRTSAEEFTKIAQLNMQQTNKILT